MIKPQTIEQWFLVYALWMTHVGSTFFALAANAGIFYVTAGACFLLAAVVVWLPDYASVLVGTAMSLNIATQGLFLRRLAKEAAAEAVMTGSPATEAKVGDATVPLQT
jgi:hypothetical protein